MNSERSPHLTRRQFFRDAARWAALAAVAAVAARLTAKSRNGPGLPGQECRNLGVCRDCAAFAGCVLPQALSAKSAVRHNPAAPQ